MGVLTLSPEEILLQQRMFEEKAKLIGQEAYYYEVRDYKMDNIVSYDDMTYLPPDKINIIFEEMPSPRTLKNLNWWDDEDSTTPPIAYLPWHRDLDHQVLLKPCVGSMLEFRDPISGFSRFFEIQQVNANTMYLIHYIVKLSPMREELHPKGTENTTSTPQGGSYGLINK